MRMTSAPAIIYSDKQLLILRKPAGLLCVPGRDESQPHLAGLVQALFPNALTVHRLDQATSGLVVMARNAIVQRQLSMAFAERQVEKTYLARVAGSPASHLGEINLPLQKDWPNRPRQIVSHPHGKPSLTRWEVIQRSPGHHFSTLKLMPHTGRSHQLRVHLAAIGHPILGDTLYAPPEYAYAYPRLMLHAWRLAFVHPVTQQNMQFEALTEF